MKTTKNGTIITDITGVALSVSQPDSIAIQDDDGAVLHISITALDKLINFRNQMKQAPLPKLDTFFTN